MFVCYRIIIDSYPSTKRPIRKGNMWCSQECKTKGGAVEITAKTSIVGDSVSVCRAIEKGDRGEEKL